jgi:REP element-mobilizing transposase RayT
MPSTHHGIQIHIVFSTKNRLKTIRPQWQDELYAYIGGICREHKSNLLAAGGTKDHLHLLVKIHPSFAISDTIKLIKGNSSRWINQEQDHRDKFQWQTGYGAFSVSLSNSDVVQRYIANQEAHHRKRSFQEEYFEILKKHKIEFDDRFVFDQEVVV